MLLYKLFKKEPNKEIVLGTGKDEVQFYKKWGLRGRKASPFQDGEEVSFYHVEESLENE